MKLLTFLSAAFILFLAVKPGIDLHSLQADSEQTCCDRPCNPVADDDQSQDKNNDCDGKSCNPFQVCSSCVLVCFNITLNSIPQPITFSVSVSLYQLTFTSPFAPDFWQPPKLV